MTVQIQSKNKTQAFSPLQKLRLEYSPQYPPILDDVSIIDFQKDGKVFVDNEIAKIFPHLQCNVLENIVLGKPIDHPLKIGVVLSGGQAPGGHNVITGIFDACKKVHPESELIGFLDGPKGIVTNQWCSITQDFLKSFRNQGGFDCIGSGRTKIETDEQFQKALRTVQEHKLDGLVIIGGDDSNTNAAFLSEYFLQHGCTTSVIGVPKTIDGDLQNQFIEISFGFDTACKIYSEIIGNLERDAISAKKYYFFVKLMGRAASHITLECALQTHPNLTFIGEELLEEHKSLSQVVQEIADLVTLRKREGKEYGVILIPEGIIEFLSDVQLLISELNTLIHANEEVIKKQDRIEHVLRLLSPASASLFSSFPEKIQFQLLLDRDPHGNVEVSKIETERLLMQMTAKELEKRKLEAEWDGIFSPVAIFCGYEGRSALPSNFDCNYAYSLGRLTVALIGRKKTGFMASILHLSQPVLAWKPLVIPLPCMMHFEKRKGSMKAVIKKSLVDLDGKPFAEFLKNRDAWKVDDTYVQPGPIQFFGPSDLTDKAAFTIQKKEIPSG